MLTLRNPRRWTKLKSPSAFMKMWMMYDKTKAGGGRNIALGRVEAHCDANMCEVGAWFFHFTGRERMKKSSSNLNEMFRVRVKEYGEYDCVVATVKIMPFPLYSREYVQVRPAANILTSSLPFPPSSCVLTILQRLLLLEDDGDIVFCALDDDSVVDYGTSLSRVVRGKSRVVVRIHQEYPDIPHCTISCIQHFDAGGSIPTYVVNKMVMTTLIYVNDMRATFQRDDEVDDRSRREMVLLLETRPEYSDVELSAIEHVEEALGRYVDAEFEELSSPDQFVKMSVVDVKGDGSESGVGKAMSVIDADIPQSAAFFLSLADRRGLKDHFEYNSQSELSVVWKNEHHFILRCKPEISPSPSFSGLSPSLC